jgi:hypothetical protein
MTSILHRNFEVSAPMPNPVTVLRSAVRAVPAVRYALGVAGIVSVIAIVKAFHLNLALAAFGTVVMFVLMTTLVIFARLSQFGSAALQRPALVFTWFCLLLTMAAALLLFTSVFFGIPRLRFLQGTSLLEDADKISPSPLEVHASSPDMEAPPSVSLGIISKNILPSPPSPRIAPHPESLRSPLSAEKNSFWVSRLDDVEDNLFSHNIEVAEVLRGSPAEQAGVRPNDVIQSVAEHPIQNSSDLTKVEKTHKQGDKVEMVVLRAGKEKTFVLTADDAVTLFERVCKRGDQAGCTNMGLLLYNGEGTTKEELRAERMFQMACERNYLRGCSSLAMVLVKERRYGNALPIVKDACSRGNMKACSLEAFMHENALGMNKDSTIAVELMTKSCTGGDSWGCLQLGMKERQDPATQTMARLHLKLACSWGEPEGCLFGSAEDQIKQRIEREEEERREEERYPERKQESDKPEIP